MPETKATVPPELAFAARQFADYYARHNIWKVPAFSSREFGFMFFDRGYVHRHIGFRESQDLARYMAERAPSHAYYSTAYYEKPWARTMVEKEWKGADLIFDLDADHVKGSERLPYEQMLQRVREQMIKLYDEFISADLGFGQDDTEIVFSGGRGYHVHIYAESVRKLGSHERREIVDYITAGELDLGTLLPTVAVEETKGGRVLKSTRLPGVSEGGWYSKTRKALVRFLDELERMKKEQAVDLLISLGLKKTQASRVYSLLFEQGRKERMLAGNVLDLFTDKDVDLKNLLDALRAKTVEWMGGQTDEPVTSDIHRLIRLPGSLHGKTSLKVVSLTRDELRSFDPLKDAAADFPDASVTVSSDKAFVSEPLGGERVTIREGLNDIPLRTALFLILRRQVLLPGEGKTSVGAPS